MKVRRLTDLGLYEFERTIVNLRNSIQQQLPQYLLSAAEYSEPVDFDIELDGAYLNHDTNSGNI